MCKRGSCGVRGRFEELAQRFGERAEIIRPAVRAKKQFVLPDAVILPPTEEIIAYCRAQKELGLPVSGPADSSLQTIRVIAD